LKETEKFPIGSDVIKYMLNERHPMIMVDRINDYQPSPRYELHAERYVSANEPVFVGHFPDLALWPGVYTIEGLRQCCLLLDVIQQLEQADLFDGIKALQHRHMLRPKVDKVLCERTIDTLKTISQPNSFPLTVRIKLLTPVFAGCVLKYQVHQNNADSNIWSVQAEVDGQSVAKGIIKYQDVPR
jgi:3-hydroxymyristoyl/3-hydroxydecanoyl-(acyl carrier protein) dehydratase